MEPTRRKVGGAGSFGRRARGISSLGGGLLLAVGLPWLRLWWICRRPGPADECVWGVPLLIAQIVIWLPVTGALGAAATWLALGWRERRQRLS